MLKNIKRSFFKTKLRKSAAVLLSAAMVATMCPAPVMAAETNTAWDGTTIDVSWYEADATEYHIKTPAQLMGLAAIVNGTYTTDIKTVIGDDDNSKIKSTLVDFSSIDSTGGQNKGLRGTDDFDGKTVYLDADLDMGGVYDAQSGTWSGARFMPIGGAYRVEPNDENTQLNANFNGVFDGQGHIVSNIYASLSNTDWAANVGFIGRMGCHNSDVAAGTDTLPKGAGVRDLAVSGYIDADRSVGGIVGKIGETDGGAFIEGCINFATVTGHQKKGTGGICGAAWNGGIIRNCVNAGSVSNTNKETGGVVGSNESTMINCYNVGTVTGTNGYAVTSDTGKGVSNCYYLKGTATKRDYDATSKTSDELKSTDFLTLINGSSRAWVADTNNINSGYPVPRAFNDDPSAVFENITSEGTPKLEYVIDQTFDVNTFKVWANWSDNTKEALTDYTVYLGDQKIDSTYKFTANDSGKKLSISGSYSGKSYSYPAEEGSWTVTVSANVPTSLGRTWIYTKDDTSIDSKVDGVTLNITEGNGLEIKDVKPYIYYADGTEGYKQSANGDNAALMLRAADGVSLEALPETFAKSHDGRTLAVIYTENGVTVSKDVCTIVIIPQASVTNGIASVTIPTSMTLSTGASKPYTFDVKVTADNAENITEYKVIIPAAIAKILKEPGYITFNTDMGYVQFDATALDGIAKESELTLSIKTEKNGNIVNVYVTMTDSDGANVFESSKGNASVSIPVSMAEGQKFKVYYVADDQTKTELTSSYADGKVSFTTNHFSLFTIEMESSYDTSWYDASAKEFTLTTAAQLRGFAEIVNGTADGIAKDNFAGKTVKLGADIALDADGKYTSATGTFGSSDYPMPDVTYYTVNSDAKIWTPIGATSAETSTNTGAKADNAFAGTFDGQGHTVSGVYTDSSKTVQGLFGVVTGTVKSVTVSGCITAKIVAGGIAADLRDGGVISDCVNKAIVYADGGQKADSGIENGIGQTGAIGGIVGNVMGSASVVKNVNEGPVVCTNTNRGGRSGGIIGLIDAAAYTVEIEKNINKADIHSYQYAGGIVGFNNSKVSPINACANSGNIFGYSPGSTYIGGIVGTSNSNITNCYNTGVKDFTNAENLTGTVNGNPYDFTDLGALVYTGANKKPDCRAFGVVTKGILLEDVYNYAGALLDADNGASVLKSDDVKMVMSASSDGNGTNEYTYNQYWGATKYYYPTWYADDTSAGNNGIVTEENQADARVVPTTLAIKSYHALTNADVEQMIADADDKNCPRAMQGQQQGGANKNTDANMGFNSLNNVGYIKFTLNKTFAEAGLTDDGSEGDNDNNTTDDYDWTSKVWAGGLDFSWYDENNVKSEYHITTPAQWEAIAWICSEHLSDLADYKTNTNGNVTAIKGTVPTKQNTFTGVQFYLDNDIDMGGVEKNGSWSGPNYYPIGSQVSDDKAAGSRKNFFSLFYASFDGQGHIVKNVCCIRNATMNETTMTTKGSTATALFGRIGADDNSTYPATNITIENIAVSGYFEGYRSTGGVVGKTLHVANGYSITVKNCLNFAEVFSYDGAKGTGGVIGTAWNKAVVENCANFGKVTGGFSAANVAGVSGANESPLSNSYNVGTVTNTVTAANAGAVALNQAKVDVTNCWALEGSAPGYTSSIVNGNTLVSGGWKTAAEMKTAAFAKTLSGDNAGSWVVIGNGIEAVSSDVATLAGSYPVPKTFTTGEAAPEEVTVSGHNTITSLTYEAIKQAAETAGESTKSWHKNMEGAADNNVTAKFVKVSDLLGTPGCSFKFEAENKSAVIGADDAYVYFTEDGALKSAKDGSIGAYWVEGVKKITLIGEHSYEGGVCTNCGSEDSSFTGIAADTSWYNTTDKEFTLNTAAQLLGFAEIVNGTADGIAKDNFAGKTVKLGADIALDADGKYTSAKGTFGASGFPMPDITYYTVNSNATIWTPIGAASSEVTTNINAGADNAFAGTFDGQDYTISGVYTDGTKTAQGLFGVLTGTVKNVKVSGCITAKIVAGGIAADVRNGGCIMNCVNNAVVYANAGQAAGSGEESSIMRGGAVGGIVGNALGTASVVNNVNNGTVTCTNTNKGGRVGGIIGLIDTTAYVIKIERNINNADIYGYQYVGGIVGYDNSKYSPINACANKGNIYGYSSGSTMIGGITGASSSDITNCYNTGNYKITNSGKSAHNAGIVSDFFGTKIENCFNTGMCLVTGSSYGAICGTGYGNSSNNKLINCYTLTDTVGEDIDNGCVTVKSMISASKVSKYFVKNPSNTAYPMLYFEAENVEVPVGFYLTADSSSVNQGENIYIKLQVTALEEISIASLESKFSFYKDSMSKLVTPISVSVNEKLGNVEATIAGVNGATENKVTFFGNTTTIGPDPVTVATFTFTAGTTAGDVKFSFNTMQYGFSGDTALKGVKYFDTPTVKINIADEVTITSDIPWAPENYSLVTYKTASKAESGKAYAYDGNIMYYSEKFSDADNGEYVYLYLAKVADAETAKANIARIDGTQLNVKYDGDVNTDSVVNIMDAQIAYDIFKGVHNSGFDPCTMLMRFAADVNGDKNVTAGDARAIQYYIHYGTFEVPAE